MNHPSTHELKALAEDAVKRSAHIVVGIDHAISCNLIANGITAGKVLHPAYKYMLKSLIQNEIIKLQSSGLNYAYLDDSHLEKYAENKNKKAGCTCGAHAIKSTSHSSWCDIK